MKFRPWVLCLFTSSVCAVAFAQRADNAREKPGDELMGAGAQAQLRANAADRDSLIEERRQALLRAEKASNLEDKRRVMQELKTMQKNRRATLRENEAKVREALKAEQEAAHAAREKKGGS